MKQNSGSWLNDPSIIQSVVWRWLFQAGSTAMEQVRESSAPVITASANMDMGTK